MSKKKIKEAQEREIQQIEEVWNMAKKLGTSKAVESRLVCQIVNCDEPVYYYLNTTTALGYLVFALCEHHESEVTGRNQIPF